SSTVRTRPAHWAGGMFCVPPAGHVIDLQMILRGRLSTGRWCVFADGGRAGGPVWPVVVAGGGLREPVDVGHSDRADGCLDGGAMVVEVVLDLNGERVEELPKPVSG